MGEGKRAMPDGPGCQPTASAVPASQSGIPIADERDDLWDYNDSDECWNCGGEGFVAHCFTEYACIYPDEGCDLCMRRCEFCAAQAGVTRSGGDAKAGSVGEADSTRSEGCAPTPPSKEHNNGE